MSDTDSKPVRGTDGVAKHDPEGRTLSPEEQEAEVKRQAAEMAELKRLDGEVLYALRGKRIDSVVYAALDHERLADYIQAEWSQCIGLHPPNEVNSLGGKGESAAEIAINLLKDHAELLKDYQALLAEASQKVEPPKDQVEA